MGTTLLGTATVLALFTIISPVAALLLSRLRVDWVLLSNVGQSFEVVATTMSGLALIGVLVTVNLQRRQEGFTAEQAARQLHLEIMREAWKEPGFLAALEVVPEGQEELARHVAFLNLYFMYLRMGVNTEQVSIGEVEDLAAHCFSTDSGKFYWRRASVHMRSHYEEPFVGALESGYRRSEIRREGIFIIHNGEPLDDAAADEESQASGPDDE